MASFDFALPIDDVLENLQHALETRPNAVLVAPPGAGKTTRVPLALLDAPWVKNRKIIMLEPRRLAARAAADRMASTLDEQVGETVGLRVRMQSRISAKTRIEVVTEGVFARMVLEEPALEGVAAVLFDEFHERSLDADMGLALALDAQSGLRDDLRLLVMSATIDGALVASLLGDAPVIESLGRAFPVATKYFGRDTNQRLEGQVVQAVMAALIDETGSILVFLPGQGEITRVAEDLTARIRNPNVDIAPLFGAMDRAAQDRAVEPAPNGRRKIVLATSIAETSLTILGVRVVIDCGLARVPVYEPGIGLTRLETIRVSRAAADQRRGRAGRTEPGVCYRLWDEPATASLAPYASPEILSADLSSLVLDLAAWGVRDPASGLLWLDPPPAPAVREAKQTLRAIGALDDEGGLTEQGRFIRALALPPRLARMVVSAAQNDKALLAAELAVVLVEKGLGGDSTDLAERVERFRRDRSKRAEDARRMAASWAKAAGGAKGQGNLEDCGALLALAFPDRIAKARGKSGEYIMANGRAGVLEPHDRLCQNAFLVIGESVGRASAARIRAAVAIDASTIESDCADQIQNREEIVFDKERLALKARRSRRLGAIVLAEQNLSVPADDKAARSLAQGIADAGLHRLAWSKAQNQMRDRVQFLRAAEGADSGWPDLSDTALATHAVDWLSPYILGRTSLASITADDLGQALQALMPWDLQRKMEGEAPTHFLTPAGSNIALDYEAEGGPVLAVRVQELYGLSTHPCVAGGRVPLTLHLLSPAHRPIQVTKDLPGFWKGSWSAVKSEMKGRYPRHLWPDDPAAALPTARAKPRGT